MLHIFRYFLFTISLTCSFKFYYKKYETTQIKIKICEKLLKSIKHGYLEISFTIKIIKLIAKGEGDKTKTLNTSRKFIISHA